MPVAEEELKTLPQLAPLDQEDAVLFDLVIIGGGPAGLTAGMYAARARLKTILIEKAIAGGLVSTTDKIENYPGFPQGVNGMELSQKMEEQARRLGLEIVWENVAGLELENNKKVVKTRSKEPFAARSVIIATGTEPKKLGVPGEEEFRGRGVSYCAICDGAFYRGKKITVVGGGDSAVGEAIYLTRFASSVTIVHRRDQLRAEKALQERASENPLIKFLWNSTVGEIRGKENVKEIVVKNTRSGEKTTLETDGVFIYIGENPATDFLGSMVKLDKNRFVITDEEMQTSVPGIFAAGDIRKKSMRQIVVAAAEGAIAANSVLKYLEEEYPRGK